LQALIMLAVLAVSACSFTQEVLEPSAIAPTPAADAALPAQGDAEAAETAEVAAVASVPLPSAVAARTHLRLDPIVGATVEVATPLTERLATSARARGMKLAGSADPAATHVLKGYFSTLSEGGETTVIYVWDVYDPAGNRLHRINGQQKAASSGGEGWGAVSPATMQAIADATVEQLAAWLATSTG
jgi:hypothetical protein